MPDAYISQFSGEEIDSALRAAQIISGASTPAELRNKLEIRGDTIPVSAEDSTLISEALTKIPTTSGGGVNPNLLDNWYFGNPVNQRGQTELTSGNWSTYFIDRWFAASPECAYAITDDGIKISKLPHQYQQIWVQKMERMEKRTYTLSFFLKDIGLLSLTFTPQGSDYTEQTLDGGFILSFTSEANLKNPMIRLLTSASVTVSDVTILAAKLELGDTQTLAHKENEKWVLNEIPDFGEQLRRCQRYFVRLTNAYGYGWTYSSSVANFLVPLPTTLRANPVVKLTKNGEIQTINGSTAVTGFEAKGIHPNGLAIDLHNSANALISGTPVTWHGSSMDISADL